MTTDNEADDGQKSSKSERNWKILFGLIILCIIGVVVAAAVVATSQNKDNNDSSSDETETEPVPVTAPTSAPVDDVNDQYDIILNALNSTEFTQPYLAMLPNSAESLKGVYDDNSQDPVVRAASWLIHEDPLNNPDYLVERFALAAIYLSMGGRNGSTRPTGFRNIRFVVRRVDGIVLVEIIMVDGMVCIVIIWEAYMN